VPAESAEEFCRLKEYVPFAFAVNATLGAITVAGPVTFTNSEPPNPVAGVAVRVAVAEFPDWVLIVAEAGLKVSAAGACGGGVTGLPPPPPPPQPAINASIKHQRVFATRTVALPAIRRMRDPSTVFFY
jgi:hypothetical protein